MDPLSVIAGKVVGYLAPIAVDKGVELGKKVGQDIVDKLAGWLDSLRGRWAGDAEATEALEQFEAAPAKNAEKLGEVLAERMESDEELSSSAQRLTETLGPLVVVNLKGGKVDIQKGPKFGNIRRGRVVVDIQLDEGVVQDGGEYGDVG